IKGFVIAGSNGQGPYLESGERHSLIKTARRRKVYLMGGVAAETTRQGLAQLAELEQARADSALVLTPTTIARGQNTAVLRFYRTLADRTSIPLFLYSVPSVTAYNLPVDTVSTLSRHENIVGMKDSSGDVVRLQSILDATPRDFILYSGASKALTAAIAVGCHGAITGSGNYVPDLVLATLAAAKTDLVKARRLQKRLSRIAGEVESHGIPGVLAAARAAGLKPGFPREPLTRLARGAETSIAKLIT
ncbi:MAG: dihydrodipicolinate synthase family protein, partial [Acidimicrobiia bacterium]